MKKIIFFCQIFLAIFVAFFIGSFLVKEVFIGYSPTIRPNLPQYFSFKFKTQVDRLTASLFHKQSNTAFIRPTEDFLRNASTQVAPGVRAAEHGTASYTEYDENNIKYKIINYKMSNGQTVKIKIVDNGSDVIPPIEDKYVGQYIVK